MALVTVWVRLLPFCHDTIVPTGTVRVARLNDVPTMQTFVAVGMQPPPPPPPPVPYVELPHDASTTTPAAPTTRPNTLDRIEPPGGAYRTDRLYRTRLLPIETLKGPPGDMSGNDEARSATS